MKPSLREEVGFLEFKCLAVNYPLQEQLASESLCLRSILNYNWDQVAGINLSVWGYTECQKVLMKLHDVAFLEVYKLTSPDCFTTDSIIFGNNLTDADRLVPPLVRQLSLFNGCSFSTVEILWKYYRSVCSSSAWRLRDIDKCLADKQADKPDVDDNLYGGGGAWAVTKGVRVHWERCLMVAKHYLPDFGGDVELGCYLLQ